MEAIYSTSEHLINIRWIEDLFQPKEVIAERQNKTGSLSFIYGCITLFSK